MINLNIIISYWDNQIEKHLLDKYKLFSTNSYIYVKYSIIETEDENQEITESFNFSKLETLNNFIYKRFKQIKQNERYELNTVEYILYKNENIIMKDVLDWEFTGFFKFKKLLDEYLTFIKHMNIEHNTKLLNNYLIKNTSNTITNTLPNEIIDMILMNI
jgi:hypothetical protein